MSESKTYEIAGFEINRSYMVIWAILLGLTLVEVFIPEMSMTPNGPKSLFGISFSRTVAILSLVGLAIVKTYCVAWFYMHLIDERPLIVLIACAPFIFSVFLTIGLFPW
jgi:hypothetical protein